MSLWWTHSFFAIPAQFLLLWVMLLSGIYFAVTATASRPSGHWVGASVMAMAVGWWIGMRFPHWLGNLGLPAASDSTYLRQRLYCFVGISFTLCRLVSFCVDTRKERSATRGLVPFLLYMCYFPTLMSGPVTIYRRFTTIEAPVLDTDYVYSNVVPGFKRIILGIFKRQLVANFLWSISLPFILIHSAPTWRLLLGAYAYYFYLFVDFSGYTDLAVGVSKIMNVNLPENFNRPFFARNPRDFWQRWHISFLDWLNQYVMTPLYTFELKRLRFLPPALLSFGAILATFVFAGIWHGEGERYLAYGVLNALVLWGYRMYDEQLRLRAPTTRKRLLASPLVSGIAILLCFHYVVFALMVFSMDPPNLQFVLGRLAHG